MFGPDTKERRFYRIIRFYFERPRYWIWWLRNMLLPHQPLPCRTAWGDQWLARNNFVGRHVFLGEQFENAEQDFLQSYLQQGMIAIDIGAHQGLYSLLLSRRVGDPGTVIAFEPSPREQARLRKHLQINRCSNVIVENAALGQTESKAKLYVYQEDELSGFNSLKEPDIKGVKDCLPVAVESLDFYLNRSGIDYSGIDFLKIDVEGGEKDILLGAKNLLTAKKRPLILCEVEDKRTKPWGYMSIEIIEILKSYGFYCFSIERGGKLKIHSDQIEVNGNLLFVPPERYQSVDHLLNSK